MRDEKEQARRSDSRTRRLLAGFALSIATVAILFGLFEVGFRMAGYEPIYNTYSDPAIFWRHDELLGWSHVPGAEGIYVGPRPWPVEFRAPVKINSIGLRGPEVADLPPGGYRILMLGDSFVAGFEVANEKTFVVEVERRLNDALGIPIQVINGGVRGYGTDQEYLWYQERGRLLRPDLVIEFMSLNDPEDNVTLHRMRRPFGKAAFSLGSDGTLELRGTPIPRFPACAEVTLDSRFVPARIDGPARRALCTLEMNLSDRSAFFTWVTLRIRRNPALLHWLYDLTSTGQIASLGRLLGVPTAAAETEVAQAPTPPYALTTALLRELARSVRASGAEFWFVVARGQWQLLDTRALEREGIEPLFGELPLTQDEIRYLQFRNDSHLNETGHAMFARWLADLLAPAIRAARSKDEPKPDAAAPAT